jgi:hypothetical protein
MDWKHLLAYITGTVDQELLVRNEAAPAKFEAELLTGKPISGLYLRRIG